MGSAKNIILKDLQAPGCKICHGPRIFADQAGFWCGWKFAISQTASDGFRLLATPIFTIICIKSPGKNEAGAGNQEIGQSIGRAGAEATALHPARNRNLGDAGGFIHKWPLFRFSLGGRSSHFAGPASSPTQPAVLRQASKQGDRSFDFRGLPRPSTCPSVR